MKKIIYVADDGCQFDSEEKCNSHDEMIAKEKARQAQLKEEKQSRYDEVKKAYQVYKKLESDYVKDYGRISLAYGDTNWFDSVINSFFGD